MSVASQILAGSLVASPALCKTGQCFLTSSSSSFSLPFFGMYVTCTITGLPFAICVSPLLGRIQFFGALVVLVRVGGLFALGRHRPAMAEWILDDAVDVAPELLVERLDNARARRHRLLPRRLHVAAVEVDCHRRAAERAGVALLAAVALGEVVDEEDDGAVERQAGVHDLLAVGRGVRAEVL